MRRFMRRNAVMTGLVLVSGILVFSLLPRLASAQPASPPALAIGAVGVLHRPATGLLGSQSADTCCFGPTGDLVIGFNSGATRDEAVLVAERSGLVPLRWIESVHALVARPARPGASISRSGVWSLDTSAESERHAVVRDMDLSVAVDPRVQYVMSDASAHVFGVPDDARYEDDQWAPQLIGAEDAWDLTTGDDAVVVAVLDSGVDLQHEDLSGKTTAGIDIVNGDSDPSDDFGHGTQVAGVIGAATNNATGVAAVGWDTRVMPVKVVTDYGSASYSDIAAGVE